MKNIFKRLIILGIASVFTFTTLSMAYATPSDDTGDDNISSITDERDKNQEKLDEVNASIEELAEASNEAQDELDEADAALVQIIAEIEVIEEQIVDKEAEIAVATDEYNVAVEKEKEQYDSMKVRIQYLYEMGNVDLISLYLETGSLSDTLTKADYIENLYEFDREMLVDYQGTVEEVANLKSDLEKEKQELVSMQSDYETEQENLEQVVDELKKISDSYAVELSAAKNKAAAYAEEIKAQNKEIKRLEEEKEKKKKIEAEKAAKAKREAEKKKEKLKESSKTSKEVNDTGSNETSESENSSNEDGLNGENVDSEEDKKEDKKEDTSEENNKEDNEDNDKEDSNDGTNDDSNREDNSSIPNPDEDGDGKVENEKNNSSYDVSSIYAAKGSELGKKIAVYACQFIGNPYVPGGTSLTNGADCSGFVYSVYKDFGYSVPRTSYALRSAGKEVSYSDAEPGDVICYAGHVAIYLGNGMIVHASTQKTGIKVSNAQYREILSVRRII